MATRRIRDYQFIVGPETSTIPSSTTPTDDEDIITKLYAENNFTARDSYENSKQTVASIKSIAAADRADNQIVYCDDQETLYRFDSSSSATGDDVLVLTPDAGTGRWIRFRPKDQDIDAESSTSGQVITSNGDGTATFATPAAAPDEAHSRFNLSLSTSVASNALTVALKTKAGSDPTSGDKIQIGFRDSTLTDGSYNVREVTAALDITVPSGATLGHKDAADNRFHLYAIDNSGTVELAVSTCHIADEHDVVSTTLLDASSDDAYTIYSETARSNVPIRLIGVLCSDVTTAGTWDAVPDIAAPAIQEPQQIFASIYLDTPNGYGSTNTGVPRYSNTIDNSGGDHITYSDSAAGGALFTINKPGMYEVVMGEQITGGSVSTVGASLNGTGLTGSILSASQSEVIFLSQGPSGGVWAGCSAIVRCVAGDQIHPHTAGASTRNNGFVRVHYIGP